MEKAIKSIELAEQYQSIGMSDSAKVCLSDAKDLLIIGRYEDAHLRALKSLAYSVGKFSEVYAKAASED